MGVMANRGKVKGVNFIVDQEERKRAVIIDLKIHRALWEDFYDTLLSIARRNEPRESLDEVRKRVLRKK
jgi:hypothetical protein